MGNLGSSKADSLAGALSLDVPSLPRGFPFDVEVPLPSVSPNTLGSKVLLPSASPSALTVPSNLERSHPRIFPLDSGVPLQGVSPSTLTVEVLLSSVSPSTLAVRRLRVPLPRGFPGRPAAADGAKSIFRGLVLATGREFSFSAVRAGKLLTEIPS